MGYSISTDACDRCVYVAILNNDGKEIYAMFDAPHMILTALCHVRDLMYSSPMLYPFKYNDPSFDLVDHPWLALCDGNDDMTISVCTLFSRWFVSVSDRTISGALTMDVMNRMQLKKMMDMTCDAIRSRDFPRVSKLIAVMKDIAPYNVQMPVPVMIMLTAAVEAGEHRIMEHLLVECHFMESLEESRFNAVKRAYEKNDTAAQTLLTKFLKPFHSYLWDFRARQPRLRIL